MRGTPGCSDARHQALGDPRHDRFKDGRLAREMFEQRTLGYAHVLGDGSRGDFRRGLVGGKVDHRVHCGCSALVCSEVLAWMSHVDQR
jgi:hypothetical protein